MDLSIIKQFLKLAGITNLAIKFDIHKQQIEAIFNKTGHKRTKLIKFAEIEALFTEGPFQASAASSVDDMFEKST